ncbi:acylneuraminate cytidylyltransferase family protein [Nisaea sp.]|uniref:acylneuraminate cytidylyltransferase family protein n=1 Tax=Nisaea sp. TaxID=2024842 RepID=UPI002B268B6D|nr:acylneuraminate cytidylyltransferase family protein [Nisaea sp.]
MRNVAIIPARKGSKRVKGKNRLIIGGQTLLDRTIAAIEESGAIQRSILCTDDLDLIQAAKKHSLLESDLRPAELSADSTSSTDVLRYLIAKMGLEDSRIILLQLTSPFRTAEDIKTLLQRMVDSGQSSGVSVCRWRMPPSPPFGNTDDIMKLGDEALLNSNMRSIAHDRTWAINGALYVFEAEKFMQTGQLYTSNAAIHVMETWRSVDIDYNDDVKIAKALARQYGI